jgi:hypothetical protein
MVKVIGPLFSVSASGVFKDTLEFRTGNGGTTVAAPRVITKPRTPAQEAQSARFAVAVAGWKSLDETAKQAWRSAALNTGLSGYQLYLSEYQSQLIQAPAQPVPP